MQVDKPRALEAWAGLRPSDSLSLDAAPLWDGQITTLLGGVLPHLQRTLDAATRGPAHFPRTPLMDQVA
eukprot:9495687-Alexandrium_andersonii.AAC.1